MVQKELKLLARKKLLGRKKFETVETGREVQESVPFARIYLVQSTCTCR